jgi:chromosome condensin MukBEF ATPase and DNA-binding subunit MukB
MAMDIPEADRIKHRLINFRDLHPERNDARTAADFLAQVDGVLSADPETPIVLNLSYDLTRTCLQEIEQALDELGLHLDNGLLYRVRRALAYYTEDTFRENCGCKRGGSNCTKRVFAKRYEALEHGCRDPRPEHWRRYL